jgi:hypothetical protein
MADATDTAAGLEAAKAALEAHARKTVEEANARISAVLQEAGLELASAYEVVNGMPQNHRVVLVPRRA